MLSYGLLTNPSNDILCEISKIYHLNFDYAELGIEGPEGNPQIINKKKNELSKLLQKFKQKPIGHTAYWIDLCSDYDYVRHAWILEAMREIRTARIVGVDLINFHANLNGINTKCFRLLKKKEARSNQLASSSLILSTTP